ncbi:hypothetical protein ZEAMMB73_Zm00001d048196 [Zea mays]|uniref:Uncharacterized protein n=1 Tax=Zea mays TaxID=4577 RepID=A0A1D6PIF0_MAIZE|nr:hypothetical protein ZEAMMB73_Zm00001d048196 [Zea mays]
MRMSHLDQRSAEKKRTAAAASAQKVSKNIEEQQKKIQQLMQPAKRPRPENVGQVSSCFNPESAITQISQLVAGSHRPVGIQNQALAVPQYGSGSLARPYRFSTLAPESV